MQAGTSDWSGYLLGDVAWEILKNGSRLDEMPPGSSNWILLPLVGGNRSSLYLSTFEGLFILCLASSPLAGVFSSARKVLLNVTKHTIVL